MKKQFLSFLLFAVSLGLDATPLKLWYEQPANLSV